MPNKQLTEGQKQRVIALYIAFKNYKKTKTELAKQRIFVSVSGIKKIIYRYRKSHTVKRAAGSGRPRKSNMGEDRQLVQIAKRERRADLRSLSTSLNNETGIAMSTTTVARRLKESGLARRPARTRPLLTAAQKARRADFARAYIRKPIAYWHRMKFSDEKIFSSENDSTRALVTRSTSERDHPSCIVTAPKWGVSVHAWGLIGWDGVGPIRQVVGTLNAERYIQQIIYDLPDLLQIRCWGTQEKACFQQDNARAHSARRTQEFLAANGVQVLPWPANSPDLNPVEHIWAHVNRRVRAHGRPRTQAELWQWVHEEWHTTPRHLVRKLIASMPRRLAEVAENEGGPIHY